MADNLFSVEKTAKITDVIKDGGESGKFVKVLILAYKNAKNEQDLSTTSAISYAVKKPIASEPISAAIGFFSIGEVYSACFE